MRLWRAAKDDSHNDSSSFAVDREAAEAYLDNPGFGGNRLFCLDVDMDEAVVLDVFGLGEEEAVDAIASRAGVVAPVGVTPDVLAPRLALELRGAGVEWVRVTDTYPVGAETWIFVGQWLDDLAEVGPTLDDLADV